jgi:hypothetical protein
MEMQERIELKLRLATRHARMAAVKSIFLPSVINPSYKRSGFQWFRQICHANLRRHVVMPPGALPALQHRAHTRAERPRPQRDLAGARP